METKFDVITIEGLRLLSVAPEGEIDPSLTAVFKEWYDNQEMVTVLNMKNIIKKCCMDPTLVSDFALKYMMELFKRITNINFPEQKDSLSLTEEDMAEIIQSVQSGGEDLVNNNVGGKIVKLAQKSMESLHFLSIAPPDQICVEYTDLFKNWLADNSLINIEEMKNILYEACITEGKKASFQAILVMTTVFGEITNTDFGVNPLVLSPTPKIVTELGSDLMNMKIPNKIVYN